MILIIKLVNLVGKWSRKKTLGIWRGEQREREIEREREREREIERG